MKRYKLKIEYDGTPFVGWQYQKNGLSIQEVIQNAIFNLSKESSNSKFEFWARFLSIQSNFEISTTDFFK